MEKKKEIDCIYAFINTKNWNKNTRTINFFVHIFEFVSPLAALYWQI